MGAWFEIETSATFRKTFESGLVCTTANYTLNADNTVRVDNSGNNNNDATGHSGRTHAIGKAKNDGQGKLEVSFFGPFYSPYWVTQLYSDDAGNYNVAVVYSCTAVFGIKASESMWVLSRTPQLPASLNISAIHDVRIGRVCVRGLSVSIFVAGPHTRARPSSSAHPRTYPLPFVVLPGRHLAGH